MEEETTFASFQNVFKMPLPEGKRQKKSVDYKTMNG